MHEVLYEFKACVVLIHIESKNIQKFQKNVSVLFIEHINC